MPVAENIISFPFAKSSIVNNLSISSSPIFLHLSLSSSLLGQSLPWNSPPMHFNAAAARTPSGAPPIPTIISAPESSRQVAIAAATSPSWKSLILPPASLTSFTKYSFLGLSNIVTVISDISLFKALDRFFKFSLIGASKSIFPTALGPAAILFIYISGACNKHPLGATATTEIALARPLATAVVPSKGSTAISTFIESFVALPISSPI